MDAWLLIQTLCVPMAAGLLILAVPSRDGRHAGGTACLALLYTSILLVMAGWRVHGEGALVESWLTGPEVGLTLRADGISLPIALVINLICLALCIFSISYVDHRIRRIYLKSGSEADSRILARYRKRFFFLYLFFPTGFMGVALSTNLMSLYLFMEVLTIIPLYFIMAQFGYSDYITRFRVALICLFWGVAGAGMFLIGILISYETTGSFEIGAMVSLSGRRPAFWVILFILLGLGTKLALVPLHVWMPWVHAEHPTCIAGLLAIYANIAVYVLARVLVVPLGPDLAVFQMPVLVLALITMVYGALLTLAQTDIKRFCACSTISQISYSVFGVMTLVPLGINGGLFYFLSHILGKAVLFSTAGILVYCTGIRDMRRLGGLWRELPGVAVLWLTAAMVLSALPPFSGFIGKWLFFTGGFQAFAGHWPGAVFIALAIMSTLLTLVYTFRSGIQIFWGNSVPLENRIKAPPLSMVLPLAGLGIIALGLGLFPGMVLGFFER